MSMKGKFVRWTATDEQGEFSYVGECIGDSKTMMIINTDKGEMLVPKDDGVIEAARKPKNWGAGAVAVAEPVKATRKPKAEKKVTERAPKAAKAVKTERAPKAGSRIAEAVAILSAADRANLTRQQMIKMLEEKLGIDDHKKASGLYQNAIKKIA